MIKLLLLIYNNDPIHSFVAVCLYSWDGVMMMLMNDVSNISITYVFKPIT